MKTVTVFVNAVIVTAISLIFLTGGAFAQTVGEFRSNGSLSAGANWSSAGSWQTWNGSSWVAASAAPAGSEPKITIQSTDSVAVDVAITISDTLLNQGKINGSTNLTIGNGGVYQHAENGGNMPTATWATGSTCLVTGSTGTAPSNANQNFYNFTWNCTGQTAGLNVGWNNITIAGNLTIQNSNSQQFRMTSSTYTGTTINIQGKLVVGGSTARIAVTGSSGAATYIVNSYGNMSVSGGVLYISGGSSGVVTWNVYGDSIIATSGSTFQSSNTASKYVFLKSGTQVFNVGTLTYTGAATFQISSGTTLDMGTSVLGGSGSFILQPGSSLITAHAGGINGNITCTGANGGGNTFSTGANYTYDGTVAQVTGALLPATVNKLSINNSNGVAMSGSVAVSDTLTLMAGTLSHGTNTLSLGNGAMIVIGSGSLDAAPTFGTSVNVTYAGGTAISTGLELPASPSILNNLIMNDAAGVTLGQSVNVNGVLTLMSGNLMLGKKNLVAASMSGGSLASYVSTDSSASYLKLPNVGATQILFPVGNAAEGYAPAWITNSGTADSFAVAALMDMTAPPSGARVNVKWNITPSAASGDNCTVQLGWMPSAESTAFAANRVANAKIYSLVGTPAEAGSGSYTTQLTSTPYSVARGGFTTFGTFAVGNFHSASTITSNGTGGGDWNVAATWQGGVLPDSTNNVVIASGDSVYVTATLPASSNNLTIQSNAKLNVTAALIVKGALAAQANSWFYNSLSNLPSFPVAASYSIDTTSNYVHTNSASGSFGTAGYDSTFGNVIMLKSGATAGASLSINGNLTVQTGGSSANFKGATTISRTHHVHGNVKLISGQWSCVDASSGSSNNAVGIWNIDGNVTVGDPSTAVGQARMGTLNSANSLDSRTGIFNISGNLSFINGAKLQAGSSTSSTSTTETGIINLKGNLTLDSTATVGTNSKGLFAINFVGSGTQTVSLGVPLSFSSSSMALTVNDTIASTSTVVLNNGRYWASSSAGAVNGGGSFIVNGTLKFGAADTLKGLQSFVLNSGATLVTANPLGVDSTSNIQVSGTRSYSTSANYLYDGTVAQVSGRELPATVKGMTIANNVGVTLSKSTTLSDSLRISAGLLYLGGDTLTLPGMLAPSSANYVVADTTGVVKINGVGSNRAMFPIGTKTSYDPVWITNSGTADAFYVSVFPDTTKTTNGLGRVNVKWKINEGTAGGSNCTLQLGWMAADEDAVFANHHSDYAKIYLLFSDSTAEAGSGSYTAQFTQQPYTVSRGGVASFGTFGVGHFTTTGVDEVEPVPLVFKLSQNYPNPFNPSTTIEFTVARMGRTTLKVYNVIGQQVATLFDDNAQPGRKYVERFNAGMLSSGVYFNVLESTGQRQIQKMILMK